MEASDGPATAWARALHGACFVSLDLAGIHRLTTRLLPLLVDGSADVVGRELVGAHFTEAVALERTLLVLAGTCPPSVLAALARGYSAALQERTRAEQERILVSAFGARAQAERARWSSESRFAAVFADSPLGIAVVGLDGRVLEVNRALCAMFGIPTDEFLRRTIFSFGNPGDDPGTGRSCRPCSPAASTTCG